VSLPIVIDCEASSLSAESYPIEVGFVLEDGTVQNYLIRPEKKWTDWSEESSKIHNIPRERLYDEGLSVVEVARILNGQLADCTCYSDSSYHETFWLDRLFHAARTDRLFDIQNLFFLFSEGQQQKFFFKKNELFATRERHRAGVDAWVIQQAYHLTK
jgi:hypothetical protein